MERSLTTIRLLRSFKKLIVPNTISTYTEQELEEMTISDIKALADEQGYSVSGNVKSLIIESFLEAQEKAVKGV